MMQINSNEELYQVLQESTAGRITKVGDQSNPMTLKFRNGVYVTIYADNHEILTVVGALGDNGKFQKRYRNYVQVYNAIMNMENGTVSAQKEKKYDRKRENKIARVTTFIWGVVFALFGGFFLLCCVAGAIRDGFQPLHVHAALLFSFGVIFLAGIMTIYLGCKKDTKLEKIVGNPYPVELPDHKAVDILLRELKSRTEKNAVRIVIDEKRKTSLTGSKLGGTPYWDLRKEYPSASDGSKLVLLAQFNFSELPENDLFPKSGLLQFFISDHAYYGLPGRSSGIRNTYRVVYHEKIDENVTEEHVLALGIRTSGDFCNSVKGNEHLRTSMNFPVIGEYAVRFKTVKAYMNDNDVRCNAILHQIAGELGIALDSRLEFEQLFDEWDERYADIHDATWGHYLSGYPQFRQEDPRSLSDAAYYDTMLFQLDSDSKFGKWRVLWGDAGVGAFFINSRKLAAMDFDDVLYTWDCC